MGPMGKLRLSIAGDMEDGQLRALLEKLYAARSRGGPVKVEAGPYESTAHVVTISEIQGVPDDHLSVFVILRLGD